MKCKLTNGQTIDIRKRFTPGTEIDVKNNMEKIREDYINKFYLVEAQEEQPKPEQKIPEPLPIKNEKLKKLTMKF